MQNTMRAHSAGQISIEGTWSIQPLLSFSESIQRACELLGAIGPSFMFHVSKKSTRLIGPCDIFVFSRDSNVSEKYLNLHFPQTKQSYLNRPYNKRQFRYSNA